MSKLPALTVRQNEAAVERAAESLALTSGAGCGKTLVLARRFTELLLRTGAEEQPFDGLVALTFTDKAAIEMLTRVRAVLLEALERSRAAADRQKLADWITELPAAHISTIHSFCASLLRRHALAAGVDPAFAVMPDTLLTGQMAADAAEQAVLSAVEAGDAGTLELLATADVARVQQELRTLIDRRIAWRPADYADPAATLQRWKKLKADSLRAGLERFSRDRAASAELEAIAAAPCGDKLAGFRDGQVASMRRILSAKAFSPGDAEALNQTPGNLGGAKAKPLRDRLKALLASFAEVALCAGDLNAADEQAARTLATLTKLAGAAIELYAAAKRRNGVLDFEDLIDLAARLLRQDRSVRQGLRRRLRQLLVDEGQDTDAYQLRMLWDLVADDDQPPSDKLFIVGDVKQSIYRFRGAQAEVFAALVERFGRKRQVSLTESFRVHPAGARFINCLFERLMDGYEPIQPRRKETPATESVEILLADCPGANADESAEQQAQLLAGRLERMLGGERIVYDRESQQWRAVRAGDVAVLMGRMTKSLPYEQALRQRGIPYFIVGGTGFFQQQEVLDLLNALSAIDNPYDDVALVGVLRSDLLGLDDNALLHLANRCRPPYFARLGDPAVAANLSEGQRRQLGFACDLLARLHRVKDSLGPAGLIEELLARTGYAAALLGDFHGRRKFANVRRLLEVARASAGGLTLADFVQRCGELVVDESRYEQAQVVGEGEDVVRLMTIHKAKGLEFPVVVLPDLNAGVQGGTPSLLVHPAYGVVYEPPAAAGEDGDSEEEPLMHKLAGDAERRESRSEDVRRLYVGITRHQDHLVLIGANVRTKDGGFKEGSHLAKLDGALGIAAALDAGKDRIDYGGYAARVALVQPSAPRPGGRRQLTGPPLAESAADAGALAEGLLAAGADSALPLAGPLLGPRGDGTGVPAGAIAATALGDFLHCPMLYRWRYELRAPALADLGGQARAGIDAATAGSVFHRGMELADFAAIASATAKELSRMARALVARALAEMEIDQPEGALADELAAMLAQLGSAGLIEPIRSARRSLRELAFVYRAGMLEVGGQMDLLYQDAGGAWHVVDYKSDRLDEKNLAEHSRRHELQMMIYLSAARAHLGASVADATLCFLRTGQAYRFAPSAAELERVPARLEAIAARIVRCRRTGQFPRHQDAACRYCPYGPLCEK